MNLQQLLDGLRANDPETRLRSAQIIGTLDEVAALETLAAQANAENDARVKEAIYWAGKRVFAAKQSGYSTLEAIIQYFHIDYEFAAPASVDDANMLRLKHEMEMRALKDEEASARRQAATKLMAGTFLTLPGLMMSRPMIPQSGDNLNASFDKHLNAKKSRAMPTKPSDGAIKILVNRLLNDANNDKRASAAVDLAAVVNNPAALPFLAHTFIKDYTVQVREAAQRSAKLIYWNAIYWEMEQNGTMAAEIEKRRGDPPPAPSQTLAAPPVAPPQPSVDEILRKAEAARRKRR
jgi:HEAT repeat protein